MKAIPRHSGVFRIEEIPPGSWSASTSAGIRVVVVCCPVCRQPFFIQRAGNGGKSGHDISGAGVVS